MNWLERARREIDGMTSNTTADTAERHPTAAMAVLGPLDSDESRASIGGNGSPLPAQMHASEALREAFEERAAILYGGGIFACRRCHQLACASSREDIGDRATRRADGLRARLGWEPGILNGEGGKPKWMRWRTFERLSAQHDDLVGQSMQGMMIKLKLLGGTARGTRRRA